MAPTILVEGLLLLLVDLTVLHAHLRGRPLLFGAKRACLLWK